MLPSPCPLIPGRPKPHRSSCSSLASLEVDASHGNGHGLEDSVFRSPSRSRRLKSSRGGLNGRPPELSTSLHAPCLLDYSCSPSSDTDSFMRPRLGSGFCGRSPPNISGRDIVKIRLLQRKKLGSGGFGSVYLGVVRDRMVAVKRLHRNAKNSRAKLESFQAECNVVHLKHPNIVRVFGTSAGDLRHLQDIHDAGEGIGIGKHISGHSRRKDAMIVMEYAGERNLLSIIDDHSQPLHLTRRVRYSLDIARAVRYLHDARIVHLDLKPSNVIITVGDACKLGDFGCCQLLDGDTGRVSPTQRASIVTGTFAYCAPELLRGEAPDTKADVYSFGITMWQMDARQRPYAGQDHLHGVHAVIFNVVAYNVRPKIPSLSDNVDGEEGDNSELSFRELYSRCWDGDRDARPSAAQLVDILSAWLQQQQEQQQQQRH